MIAPVENKAPFQFGYRRCADQDAAKPARHPVVIVGAGPVGLAAAIDLAQRGHPIVLIDDNDRIGAGSRAICFSKRSLEVADRLGVGAKMVAKGVRWQVGRVFLDNDPVYQFDLLPELGYKRPAFVNLQQYYVEAYLAERARELSGIDLRWRNTLVAIEQFPDHVTLTIETPDGPYTLEAEWLIAADGARSPTRGMLGLPFHGQVFNDRFLIVDIKMTAPFPPERWFWFDPPFHRGQSVLLHKQPDDIWRVDFQLGLDADQVTEATPECIIPRLKAMLGDNTPFEIEWMSVYTFQCRRLEKFRHGRVVFAGDAAHQVSPFGARGANSGLEDAQNLSWKLAAVLDGEAGAHLIDSYATERELAADDNIGHSTRATDFISPKSPMARIFRNATLGLAKHAAFAKAMVNSGRLSTPTQYDGSPLSSTDNELFKGMSKRGLPVPDAALEDAHGRAVWLLDALDRGFTALMLDNGTRPDDVPDGITLTIIGHNGDRDAGSAHRPDLFDRLGQFTTRYDATPGAVYLIRPDQYLCARFRGYSAATLATARQRALGQLEVTAP